ncbi:MAG: hypothetical protein ACYDBJ_18005 [Aggregatilineales bacterium]
MSKGSERQKQIDRLAAEKASGISQTNGPAISRREAEWVKKANYWRTVAERAQKEAADLRQQIAEAQGAITPDLIAQHLIDRPDGERAAEKGAENGYLTDFSPLSEPPVFTSTSVEKGVKYVRKSDLDTIVSSVVVLLATAESSKMEAVAVENMCHSQWNEFWKTFLFTDLALVFGVGKASRALAQKIKPMLEKVKNDEKWLQVFDLSNPPDGIRTDLKKRIEAINAALAGKSVDKYLSELVNEHGDLWKDIIKIAQDSQQGSRGGVTPLIDRLLTQIMDEGIRPIDQPTTLRDRLYSLPDTEPDAAKKKQAAIEKVEKWGDFWTAPTNTDGRIKHKDALDGITNYLETRREEITKRKKG